MHSKKHILLLCKLILLSIFIAGCGGGGGGGVSLTNFAISGTAATGAAISFGAVEANCRSGSGTATSNYDGTFTIEVKSGALPCILKATDPVSKLELHSLIEVGASKANITPLTELAAANVLGEAPVAVFSSFTGDAQMKVTSAALNSAALTVQAASAALGPDADVTGVDIMKGSMVASTESMQGDAADKKIDALMAALAASDKKISDLSNTLKSVPSAEAAKTGILNVVGESAYALDSCPSARSGSFWFFGNPELTPLAYLADFKKLELTKQSTGVKYEIVPILDASHKVVPCTFSTNFNGLTYEYRISDGGLGVVYSSEGGGLIIPAQKRHQLTDASFAGTYPAMAFVRSKTSSLRLAVPIRFEIDAKGKVAGYACDLSKAIPDCQARVDSSNKDDVTCSANTDGTFSCDSQQSGFNAVAALYLTGSQATMVMSIKNMKIAGESYTGMVVMTKASQLPLPAVGDFSPAGAAWNIYSSASGLTKSYSLVTTVTAVDLTKNSFTSKTKNSAGVDVFSDHFLNTPAKGFIYSTNNSSEAIQLRSSSGWAVSANRPSGSYYYSNWLLSARVPR